jgi:hypothetical protein
MHDVLRVRGAERIGQLLREVENLGERERAAVEALPERLPFEPFHRDERLAAIGSGLVDGADMRVIEARQAGGFKPESRQHGVVERRRVPRKELEGDPPGQP